MLRKLVSVLNKKDKSKRKAQNGTSAAAPVSSTTTVFREMPKQFIHTTEVQTSDMTEEQTLRLLGHNLAAVRAEVAASGIDVSPEAVQRAREAQAAREKTRAEARAASEATQLRANQACQPVVKEQSFFSSFCSLFTCCFSARRKAPKEEKTSLLRQGIN